MPGRLVHFEFPVEDAERAKQFWSSLFGWQFQSWDGPVEYHMTQAGGDPGGALFPSENAGRGANVYFDVDDIKDGLARVRELGGEAEEAMPIPGVGWSAFCKDSEGNSFGLYQSDESAPVPEGQQGT
jgi:uncharacterized protein